MEFGIRKLPSQIVKASGYREIWSKMDWFLAFCSYKYLYDNPLLITSNDTISVHSKDLTTKSYIIHLTPHRSKPIDINKTPSICRISALGTISPNEFVSGSNNGILKVWNLTNKKLLHTWTAHDHIIIGVKQISAEEFISIAKSGPIKIWEIGTYECLHSITVPKGNINSFLLHSSGKLFLHGWDISILDLIHERWESELQTHELYINSMQEVEDKKIITLSSQRIRVWNVQEYKIEKEIVGKFTAFTYVPGANGGKVNKYGVAGDQLLSVVNNTSPELLTASKDGCLSIWEFSREYKLMTHSLGSGRIQNMAYLAEGILMITYSQSLGIWDIWGYGCLNKANIQLQCIPPTKKYSQIVYLKWECNLKQIEDSEYLAISDDEYYS